MPLLLLFLAGATFISGVSYRSGQNSVESFGRQFGDEVTGRISDQLNGFLAVPELIVQANVNAIRSGLVDVDDRAGLMHRLIGQIRYSRHLTFASIGLADGEYVGATRTLDTDVVRLITAEAATGMHFNTHDVDSDDRRGRLHSTGAAFDARTRDWFQLALAQGAMAWYPVYKYQAYDSLGIGVSAPAYDPAGRFVGVVTGDVALVAMDRYLQSRPLGLDSVAFVADAHGHLLATSTGTRLFGSSGDLLRPLAVGDSEHPLIRGAAAFLAAASDSATPNRMTIQGRRYLVRMIEHDRKSGMRLKIGLIIPEARLVGQIQRNFQLAFAVMLATLIAGTLLGLAGEARSEDRQSLASAPIRGGPLSTLVLCTVLGLSYFLLGKLAFSVSVQHGTVTSVVFTPEGASLAFCILFGRRVAPGIFLGQMMLTFSGGQPLIAGALIGVVNSFEGMLGTYLFRRLQLSPSLDRPRDVGMLVVLIFLVLQPFSATGGIAVLVATGSLAPGDALNAWFHWWIGNSMGQLLVAPLLLCWIAPSTLPPMRVTGFDLLGATACVLVMLLVTLGSVPVNPFLLLAITSPLLVWVGIRLGMRGTVVANVLVVPALIVAAGAGDSIMAELSLDNRIAFTSFFVAAACIPSTMILALLNERRTLVERLTLETQRASTAMEVAQSASVAKTRFLAAASHDLRQPLQALTLFVTDLRHHADQPPSPMLVDNIQAAADGLGGLLDALLDLSALDAGAVTAKLAPFPLESVFAALRREFGALASAKGVQLRVVRTSRWVRSDRAMFERILRNLVSNAVRYTPRGAILMGCRGSGPSLRVEVRDSGPGIPREMQQEIFKEFVRIGERGRNRDRGLGLGLSIVERLAKILGHRVDLMSEPGRGSTFKIQVPQAEPSTEPSPVNEGFVDLLSGQRVAVIDDDPLIREGLRRVLGQWGCEVIDGESADDIIAAADRPPAAILADYRLGEGRIGSIEIARLCAHFQRTIPAGLATGETSQDSLREIAATGYPVIHKPVQAFRLRALLSSLIASAT